MRVTTGRVLGVLLVLGCADGAPDTGDTGDNRLAVESALLGFFEAFSAGDSARLREVATRDFALVELGRWPMDTLLQWIEARKARGDAARFAPDNLTTQVHGTSAYVIYDNHLTATTASGSERFRSFLESALFRYQDGGWRVALIHVTPVESDE